MEYPTLNCVIYTCIVGEEKTLSKSYDNLDIRLSERLAIQLFGKKWHKAVIWILVTIDFFMLLR